MGVFRPSSSPRRRRCVFLSCYVWVVWGLILSSSVRMVEANDSQKRNVQILNRSGSKIHIYWINRWNNNELVVNTDEGGLLYGADTSIDSFVTHEFEIQELPHSKTKKCTTSPCRSTIFQVNENDNQIITLNKDFTYEYKDNKSVAREEATQILQDCKDQHLPQEHDSASEDAHAKDASEMQLHNLVKCVQDNVQKSLDKSQEEIEFQRSIRTTLATKLDTYACHDLTLQESTEVMRNDTHTFRGNRKNTIEVGVYHDRSNSQIMYIANAITPQQCQAFTDLTSSDELATATSNVKVVNVPYATSTRKQKGAIQKWINHMVDLTHTIMTTSNHQELQLQLEEDTIVSMEYQKADNDNDDDDDGSEEPYQSLPQDRVATMTVYCQVAEKGGAASFSQAGGIHIQPTVGSVVLTTYDSAKDNAQDEEEEEEEHSSHKDLYTQQHECPVVEGSKHTVTFHMRRIPS